MQKKARAQDDNFEAIIPHENSNLVLLRWDTRFLINFNYLCKKRHVHKMTILKQLFPTESSRDLFGKTTR